MNSTTSGSTSGSASRRRGLDTDGRRVSLADGTEISYDVLVIATGATARPSPWQPASGVLQLRTLDDSRAIAASLIAGERVVVVGGGFIGTEIAAAAIGFGCQVTVVDPVPEPMTRLVGAEIASSLVDLHRENGAETRFGVGVVDIRGEAGDSRSCSTTAPSSRHPSRSSESGRFPQRTGSPDRASPSRTAS